MSASPVKKNKKARSAHRTPASPRPGPGKQAQVRLRPEEMDDLQEAMRTLNLESASDALRAGLRLLVHEAAEVRAANEIREFYGGAPAPLPDGAAEPTEAELKEADKHQW